MNDQISRMVKSAIEQNPDVLVLPEKWRPIPDKDHFQNAFQPERGEDYSLIKSLSKEYGISILSGGIWEKRSADLKNKPFITCYYFDEHGDEIGRQDKMHLYNYEPSIFQPGTQLNVFTHKKSNTVFTILICFDVSFFETPRLSIEHGAEILISPTLIRDDGLYNWNIYLQARALENRIPIVACNPIGDFFDRHFSGKSKIIQFKVGKESPSELIIDELPANEPGVLTKPINLSFPNTIRKKRVGEKLDIEQIRVEKMG
jgi:omega-amidase